MKISLVVDRLAERGGGAERVIVEAANLLVREGHEVEIITHEPRNGLPAYEADARIKHTNLNPSSKAPSIPYRAVNKGLRIMARCGLYFNPVDRLVWSFQNRRFYQRLEAYLNQEQPDIIVAFLPPSLVALGLAQLSFPGRKLASIHSVPEREFDRPERWDPNPYDRKLRKAVLNQFEKISVLLPEFVAWFPEDLRGKLVELPNVINPVAPEALVNAKREKTIVSVGRIADGKRQDLLLDAWALIHENYPDWGVKIYGEGPLENKLRKQVRKLGLEDSVKLVGYTPKIFDEYLKAEFMVHPSEFEGFGLAVGEAMVHGLPVIGFADCTGLNSFVKDGVNGKLVEPKPDPVRNLAKAMSDMIEDDKTRDRLAKNAVSSMDDYRPENVHQRWLAFIE